MHFEPIAVVGRACTLPDALSPAELWANVLAARSSVAPAPEGHWGLSPAHALGTVDRWQDRAWSDAGGYVRGFDARFDPSGFGLDPAEVRGLDPVFRWTLHGVRECLREAGMHGGALRGGLVLGNLSFPTRGMYRHAESVWLDGTGLGPAVEALRAKLPKVDARERFMSGLPAILAAKANGLSLGGVALDAACASSLYAIKLACDRLHAREADVMVAGAVNAADDLFIHIGFCALGAMSKTGQSRPFHREADGLVPAEGAGFVVLQRLSDAVRDGKTIYGVIRGVGLSNDARGRGLLAPSEEGQRRALAAAYEVSGLRPSDIGLIECHATGTPVGDATEVRSMGALYGGLAGVPIGSLKGNLGHLITAAGMAALFKVMGALDAGIRPPTLHTDRPLEALAGSPFRLLTAAEPWVGPRRAAVSAFGFGGNNAHLLVESYDPSLPTPATPSVRGVQVAVVALGARVGHGDSAADFTRAVVARADDRKAREQVHVATEGLKFPPKDLGQTLAQQLLVLEAAREAVRGMSLPRERTMVVVGMGTDPDVARYGARWRSSQWADAWSQRLGGAAPDGWVARTKEAFLPSLEAAGVVGTMPNIVTNRLSSQLDLGGPGFSVSAEEGSGLAALDLALHALRAGEVDVALVGATDLSHHTVHRRALDALSGAAGAPGDGAVVLTLERLDDARAHHHPVLAVFSDDATDAVPVSAAARFGRAHAASGLIDLAAAVVSVHHRARPDTADAAPWIEAPRASLSCKTLGGQTFATTVTAGDARGVSVDGAPKLYVYAGATAAEAMAAMDARTPTDAAGARVVLVAASQAELRERSAAARRWIEQGGPQPDGVAFRAKPIGGELGFVFTGAAGAYAGMGRELCLAAPHLVERLAARSPAIASYTQWVYRDAGPSHPLDQLWGASFLTQLHAMVTREVMKLSPSAAIGYSSGESNSLFATGAWNDLDAMVRACAESSLFRTDLVEDFLAPRARWAREGLPGTQWSSWCVAAPIDEVRAALSHEPQVRITIINAPDDCVIAGEAEACERAVQRIGRARVIALGYDMTAHCPEVGEVREAWWALHHRACAAVPTVRFYTNATGEAYVPTPAAAADAITGQALDTLNFPRTIERAWRDGVRVFLEHGPRGRCTQWIKRILGDREHVAITLDVPGRSAIRQVMNAAAQLVAAGVAFDHAALEALFAHATLPSNADVKALTFPAHMPEVRLMPFEPAIVTLPEAPALPSVLDEVPAPSVIPTLPSIPRPSPAVLPQHTPTHAPAHAPTPAHASVFAQMAAFQAQLSAIHQNYLQAQSHLHGEFMRVQSSTTATLLSAYAGDLTPLPPLPEGRGGAQPIAPVAPSPVAPLPVASVAPVAPLPVASVAPIAPLPVASVAPSPLRERGVGGEVPGPKFSRAQLEILASGKISSVFGPEFAPQDGYHRQVRMPEPPLLLADRVTGIDAPALSMKTGTIWTETDVQRTSWYLDTTGRMPAGVMIESGQADLLLISWLGIDMLNKSERVYRLLGCELTYQGELPKPGDTLCYDIHVDGHAAQGDVRLFFFHYDCRINGEIRLSVRHGQAGFFTDEELANSAGVLWSPEDETIDPSLPWDAAPVRCQKTSLTADDLKAFSEGRTARCFGEGFGFAETHVRTAHITPGRMLFLDRVTEMSPDGGPWKRGYLRAETDLAASDWFLDGHFKNDPCMPGTLMFEGCLQAMAVHLTSLGFTLPRDGWRFEPVPGEKYPMRCRGQATPESRLLVYEVFVREIHGGDSPTVFADLLCTVDGRKAFHARRVGLRLVPDWPLEDWRSRDVHRELPREGALALQSLGGLKGYVEPRPVAGYDDFKFDYDSLLACAWGRPSGAFGPFYTRFDGIRRVARLPGPPYHFMSRVVSTDKPVGLLEPGANIVVEYDIPQTTWYFAENASDTMPFCVLMEAALQPCGWLASYVGSACASEKDLLFRNLDGTGTLLGEIKPGAKVLTSKVKITSVSQSAGMIIESFEVECLLDGSPIYTMKTVFGYFPPEAFENQVGLPVTDAERARIQASSDFNVDLTSRPARYCEGSARLPRPMLLMLDRVSGYWPDGGSKGLGYLRGEKDVEVTEWFFKAHFFQDPVQPGSLGVEALIQLLQFFMLENDLGANIPNARFEPIRIGHSVTWKYRGQVVPKNKRITSEIEITEVGTDAQGAYAICNGWLWVDGKRIYGLTKLGMRIVPGPEQSPKSVPEETLDPATDTWLADHRPTWTLPALPMMSMVDRLVQGAERALGATVASLTDVQVQRWLPFSGAPIALRTEAERTDAGVRVTLLAWREANDPKLSRFEPVATGLAHTRLQRSVPTAGPLADAAPEGDPYASGALFHGPAFQYLTAWQLGTNGATGTLDAARGTVPHGRVHQGLLDAATHVIPHDALGRWSADIGDDVVGYPYRIKAIDFERPLPSHGDVTVEARFAGFDGEARFPCVALTLSHRGERCVALTLVEVLLPKGPIGSFSRELRRAFLRDAAPRTGVSLSTETDGFTTLTDATVRQSDWLPGNIATIYNVPASERGDLTLAVAVREHVARRAFVHPSTVSPRGVAAVRPLRIHPTHTERRGDTVMVHDHGPSHHDLEPMFGWWRRRFGLGHWLIEDLYRGLIHRFVGDVVLADPAGFAALRGRPCLYVANHQVGVESILFSTIVSALSDTSTVTLAKAEHRESWIGHLLQHSFSYPGSTDQGVIRFFEREDREALIQIVSELAEQMASGQRSVMVHVEGTRATQARQPVVKMSSAFIDMAIAVNAPIVPVRFVGGLPIEALDQRSEFPVGYGRQDYWLGAPIYPDELRNTPLKERKSRVLGALNALGPALATETPFEGDATFERAVSNWRTRTGASEPHAVMLAALLSVMEASPETHALRHAVESGALTPEASPKGAWLADFARWLFGPHGPAVRPV